MKAIINNKEVSQKHNGTFIVLEAGATHNGLDSAKRLVDLAKNAGADSVKFQMLSADRLMADKDVKFEYKYLNIKESGEEEYLSKTELVYDILKRRELSKEEWTSLKQYCDSLNIHMFSTATYPEEVDFIVDQLGIDSIKINSGDVNELEFIRYCASKGINIQLDTGNADIWEIERAVIIAEDAGCQNIIIHLCPSGYPARLESINLKMLVTLRQLFPTHSIAFSDHTPGWDMDIAAVALGADMVEKTITLDRTIKSCEHSFSLEESGAKKFVQSIRQLEIALGSSRRTIPTPEKEKRKLARRSPYALKDMGKGLIIQKSDFEFKRPGFGISSEEFGYFLGKKLLKSIKQGDKLTYEFI